MRRACGKDGNVQNGGAKKMLKKGLAVVIAVMTMMGATGCQSDSEASSSKSGGGTTLNMSWWGNQVRNERTQQALDQYHELHADVTIEGQFFQWDDYWSKLATSAAGKKLPDLVQMDIGYMDQYVKKGQLLDLTPYIESGKLNVSDLPENVLSMGKVDGGNYGIAAGVSSPALLYNKTLLESAGITVKDNMTMDEFVQLAKEVYEKTGYSAALYTRGSFMETWVRGKGIQNVGQKLGAKAADEYFGYFDIYEQGIKEGWNMAPGKGMDSSAIEQNSLVYGSGPDTMTWCSTNGSNLLTAYQNAAPEGTTIGITTLPSDNPTLSKYLKPSMLFSISADTKDPDTAVAVLDYLINSTEANEILLGERGVLVSSKVAEALASKLSKTEQEVIYFINEVVATDCSPMDPPAQEGSSEVSDLLTKTEEKVGYGELTAKQAAEEYFKKGNEIFSGKQE